MNPGTSRRVRRATLWMLTLLAAGLAATGCAKRATRIDVGYTVPEGEASTDARLVVWPATPTTMSIYKDNTPLGPSPNDDPVGSQSIIGEPMGTIHAMLFDGTLANRYQILRREPGGGYGSLFDFNLVPTRKWLPEQWEAYKFVDRAPAAFQPPTYIGRGVVDGVIGTRAPLSNPAVLSSGTLGNIDLSVTLDPMSGGPGQPDTVSIINWTTVPGATDYVLHIYEFRIATTGQQQQSGLPAPIYDGQARDHFVVWFRWNGAMSVPKYRLGDSATVNLNAMAAGTPTDATVMYQRELLPQPDPSISAPVIRVSAYDAAGRMLAYSLNPTSVPHRSTTPFPRNFGLAAISDTEYGAFPLGGLQVEKLRLPRPR